MTRDRYRPVVAIEVNGLLGIPLPPNLATMFIDGTGAEITYRRESFPARFVVEPRWDFAGEYKENWAFFGRGVMLVKRLLEQDIEIVWASRFQQATNLYFSQALGLPDLPIATLDDGRLHTTEAHWKASQLGQEIYNGRPLLWIADELTAAGRYLLERWRRPADWHISHTKYIPDFVSDGDVAFIDEWLEDARSASGQAELRRLHTRFMGKRRGHDFSTDLMHRNWAAIRKRLDDVVDFRSGLAIPLAAYAVDHAGNLDLRVIRRIREEWGTTADPTAEELLSMLRI
jgi:hypothetical protein